MQRVTSLLPSWDKTKTGSKKGFDKAWGWADKLGAPVNKFTNKIGSEAFWPTTLDKECDKAARILRSFCKDGFYAEDERPTADTVVVKGKQRVLKKIPQTVIQNAVGLAIFTTMRSGLWVSGAGGSGVLIARKEDGEWSPPSGILLHTAGIGFLVGVDIYDCVVVINNRKALDAFTKIRATLGGEISAVAGPVGVGGVLENDGKWKQVNRPVFTYLKSRGFYAGVQVDGTVIIERNDENERFYGEKIGVADILAGKARHPPYEIKMLMETIKSAEGRSDVNSEMMDELADQPAPGDVDVVSPTTARGPTFGLPEPDDPDPFGVIALEAAGLEIREAGTRSRPSSSQFEYNPSPTSPVFSRFSRPSMDTIASRSARNSYVSRRASVDRSTQTIEMGTQTDEPLSPTSPTTSRSHSDEHNRIIEEDENEHENASIPTTIEPEEIDYTKIDLGPFAHLNHSQDFESTGTTANDSSRDFSNTTVDYSEHMDADSIYDSNTDEIDVDDLDEEEPVIFEAAAAQATIIAQPAQAILARGGLVNIPKRGPPPPLPPRSAARAKSDAGLGISPMRSSFNRSQGSLNSPTKSPVKSGFEEVDVHGADRSSVEVLKPIVLEDHEEKAKVVEEPSKKMEGAEMLKVDDSAPKEVTASESEELREKLNLQAGEDDFHSVPSTPNERPLAVEVK